MWRSIGARATGRARGTHGAPCQDAFAYASLTDDLVAIAVADGAGSAASSSIGAEVAVARAIVYLTNVCDLLTAGATVWRAAVRGAFEAARGSLVDLARVRNQPAGDFATTLQLVVASHDACCYGRLGAGGCVGRLEDGALLSLSPTAGYPFVNGASLLTSATSEPDVFFYPNALSACAVFTDGLEHLAMHLADWRPHRPFFAPLFEFVAVSEHRAGAEHELGHYLRTKRFDERTDDDRTLVLAVWSTYGNPPYPCSPWRVPE
jgi:hypothetical protein